MKRLILAVLLIAGVAGAALACSTTADGGRGGGRLVPCGRDCAGLTVTGAGDMLNAPVDPTLYMYLARTNMPAATITTATVTNVGEMVEEREILGFEPTACDCNSQITMWGCTLAHVKTVYGDVISRTLTITFTEVQTITIDADQLKALGWKGGAVTAKHETVLDVKVRRWRKRDEWVAVAE